MNNRPKRRRKNDNPYSIWISRDGKYWVSFIDGLGKYHEVEIDETVFEAFDDFELEDVSELNEVDRHFEQSELTEETLYTRASSKPLPLEEEIFWRIEHSKLMELVDCLPSIQRRRFIMYFIYGLSLDEIAMAEGCAHQPIQRSIYTAKQKILKNFENRGAK